MMTLPPAAFNRQPASSAILWCAVARWSVLRRNSRLGRTPPFEYEVHTAWTRLQGGASVSRLRELLILLVVWSTWRSDNDAVGAVSQRVFQRSVAPAGSAFDRTRCGFVIRRQFLGETLR